MRAAAPAHPVFELPPHAQLLQMITARWLSQAIAAAAKLNIADQLASGPRTIAELAAATHAQPERLYRLLRALASVGIFTEVGGTPETDSAARRFGLTPLAEPLRSDAPYPMRGAAMMFGEEWSVRAWAELARSVQTGETGFNHVYGEGLFDYLPKHPDALEIFHLAMQSFTALTQDSVVLGYDFSKFRVLTDVGGGNGRLIAAILAANPRLRGILYDSESVLASAKPVLDAAGVADRCTLQGGNFFEVVPSGADAIVLKHIIHDWDDDKSAQILSHCRRALGRDGRLLIIETVVAPGNEPSLGKLLDLEMIVMAPGGRERTEEEFHKIFAAGGFRLARVIPTASPVCILEGLPA
jgi:SAM-dependent methyltransferase